MHNTGFASYGYTESGASAVCAYDPQRYVDVTSDYCSCSPNTIYLDIVFVVDTSDDMTIGLVGDVGWFKINIQTFTVVSNWQSNQVSLLHLYTGYLKNWKVFRPPQPSCQLCTVSHSVLECSRRTLRLLHLQRLCRWIWDVIYARNRYGSRREICNKKTIRLTSSHHLERKENTIRKNMTNSSIPDCRELWRIQDIERHNWFFTSVHGWKLG